MGFDKINDPGQSLQTSRPDQSVNLYSSRECRGAIEADLPEFAIGPPEAEQGVSIQQRGRG